VFIAALFFIPSNRQHMDLHTVVKNLEDVDVETATAAVAILFKGGANPYMKDNAGYTPLPLLLAYLANVHAETIGGGLNAHRTRG